jgi:mRNA interferase RelE/StbE
MSESFSVLYTSSALKDLRTIEKKNSQKIVLTIQKYTSSNPLGKSKKLSGIFEGLYRYRIGNYRAIFKVDVSGVPIVIIILKIKHRKDIYKNFS